MVTITLSNGTQVSVSSNEDAIAILMGIATPATKMATAEQARSITAAANKEVPANAIAKTNAATTTTDVSTGIQGELDLGLPDKKDEAVCYWKSFLDKIAPMVAEHANLRTNAGKRDFCELFKNSTFSLGRVRGGRGGTLKLGFHMKELSAKRRVAPEIRKEIRRVAFHLYKPDCMSYHNPERASEEIRAFLQAFKTCKKPVAVAAKEVTPMEHLPESEVSTAMVSSDITARTTEM